VPSVSMNTIAEQSVKLVLAVGQHDADYVDTFYGPPEWKTDAERRKLPWSEIRVAAKRLLDSIPAVPADSGLASVRKPRFDLQYRSSASQTGRPSTTRDASLKETSPR